MSNNAQFQGKLDSNADQQKQLDAHFPTQLITKSFTIKINQ